LADGRAAPPGVADVAPAQAQTLEVGEPITEMPTSGFGYWRNSPMVVCKIMSTDRPGGNEPAHPSINGSPHLVVQRNVLVRIPYDFYLVIKQAGGTKLVPGAKAEDPLIAQHYLEYPMSDVQLPPQAEIDAWRAKTEGDELGKPKAESRLVWRPSSSFVKGSARERGRRLRSRVRCRSDRAAGEGVEWVRQAWEQIQADQPDWLFLRSELTGRWRLT
jgi:hypothetical protein